jgi:hypothetical protein
MFVLLGEWSIIAQSLDGCKDADVPIPHVLVRPGVR